MFEKLELLIEKLELLIGKLSDSYGINAVITTCLAGLSLLVLSAYYIL